MQQLQAATGGVRRGAGTIHEHRNEQRHRHERNQLDGGVDQQDDQQRGKTEPVIASEDGAQITPQVTHGSKPMAVRI